MSFFFLFKNYVSLKLRNFKLRDASCFFFLAHFKVMQYQIGYLQIHTCANSGVTIGAEHEASVPFDENLSDTVVRTLRIMKTQEINQSAANAELNCLIRHWL